MPPYCRLAGVNLAQQIGVAVGHAEEFDQCERGLVLAVLVAGKGIGAAAEDRRSLALVEREFLAGTRESRFPRCSAARQAAAVCWVGRVRLRIFPGLGWTALVHQLQ